MSHCLAPNSVGLRADPVHEVGVPGESSGVADLTSGGGTEGDNTDLLPLLSGDTVLVNNVELHVEGTARVSAACSLASGGVNAHDSVSDDAVDGVTLGVGDDGQVLDHPQDGGDASGAVAGLSPSGAGHELANISGVGGGGLATGLDVVVESNGRGKLNKSDVVGQGVGVPLGVGPAVEGGDLNSVGLG